MARILATLAVLFAIGFAQDTPAAESSETLEDSPSADVAAPIDTPQAPAPEEPIAAAPVEPEAPEPEPVVAAPIATQPPPVAPAAPIATPAPVAPVAPVAPAAPAAPVSGNPAVVEIPEAPEGLEGDNLITYHREAYLSALASANIIGSKGCWLYGDYINGVPNIRDPVNCARACESDEKCYHWNFQVMSKRCDLKAENGGVNRDISNKAFEDFEAVAEDLLKRRVTSRAMLAVEGGSNGGLLVGNMLVREKRELLGAVVCQVPLLDMKRYSQLLAGASWMGEYGDPSTSDRDEFLHQYSPYHLLKEDSTYPAALFMTSTRDDRVHPGHARKMVAKLLEHPTAKENTFYYENIEGGHGGAADNKQRAFMQVVRFAFLWRTLMNEKLPESLKELL